MEMKKKKELKREHLHFNTSFFFYEFNQIYEHSSFGIHPKQVHRELKQIFMCKFSTHIRVHKKRILLRIKKQSYDLKEKFHYIFTLKKIN